MKSQERFSPGSGKERGKVTIIKYSQSILSNKGLLFRENDFSRSYNPGGKDISPIQALFNFSVSPKGGRKKI